jgi:OOP family OmpA-OmpF porin
VTHAIPYQSDTELMHRVSLSLRFLCVLLACLASLGAAAQASDSATLLAAIEKARKEQVDVLAPASFQAAVQAQQAAAKEASRGRSPDKVRARVQEGETALQRATTVAASARQGLAGIIKTREDALVAEAPKRAAEQWTKADERFRQAMIENERGELRNAQKRAAEAEVLLRDAELAAIKSGVLDEARGLIAQADAAKVENAAPRSLDAAKRYLAESEQEVQRNRYDLAAARKLAAQASYEARHAMYLSKQIEGVRQQEDDDQAGIEALILSVEEPLKRAASEVDLSAEFDKGLQPPIKSLGEHASRQAQELRRLKQELDDQEEQIASLNAQLQRMESRLGGVSDERIALQRRVDAQERLRNNVATVEGSFTPEEARVYRQGEDVVISLLGIRFPSGRSSIDGSSAPLLRKVQQALQLFPGSAISVEGHTDANGSDSANLILSQDRADAVKHYVVANFGTDAEKISSIGYGEARPVATNETAEGRARNRRIDLIIHVDGER